MIDTMMLKDKVKIAVMIPCFNEEKKLTAVVSEIPAFVSEIILVDDGSRDKTFLVMEELKRTDGRIVILQHPHNLGIGAAVMTAMKHAYQNQNDIMIKLDGDGQMPVSQILPLITPLLYGDADFTKGNRFSGMTAISNMPKFRLIGNLGLSFLIKLASGYWDIIDPTNGFIALKKETYELIQDMHLASDYFFESSLLCTLGLHGAKVKDITMPSCYFGEKSSLSILKTLVTFPPRIFRFFLKRIIVRKILYTLSLEIIFVLTGLLLSIIGMGFGLYKYYYFNFILGTATPSGVVMLAAMPIIFAQQMFLAALLLDVANTPKVPITKALIKL